jgi:hypothetical protein
VRNRDASLSSVHDQDSKKYPGIGGWNFAQFDKDGNNG